MNLVGVSEGLGELVGRKDKATLFFPFAPGPLQIYMVHTTPRNAFSSTQGRCVTGFILAHYVNWMTNEHLK